MGQAMMFEFDPARGFGVYIHWPYCARICPYCDFNVYAAKTRDPAPLLQAIHADLASWRERSGPRRVDSIFLGGGTPSLLAAADIAGLIEQVDRLWGLAPNAEITLEANPEHLDALTSARSAGVNRLSLGVQALSQPRLTFLGRTHDPQTAMTAMRDARDLFPSVSIDLIYALPNETPDDWRAELGAALALAPDHLSLYQLSIEPGAAFAYAVRRRAWEPASEDAAADLYAMTQDMCAEAGCPAYEVSNHARGAAHRGRHNLIYWRCGDWVGVGPGAHGRLTADGRRLAVKAADRPPDYIAGVGEGAAWRAAEELSALDEARERLAMGLRLVEGVRGEDIASLGFMINRAAVEEFAALGLLIRDGAGGEGRLRLSASGRLVADRIVQAIAP